MAQHALVVHHQADHLARRAGDLLRFQHAAADEVAAFVQRHRPGQRGLERRHRIVHVLAVEVHAGLQAQRVARTQAGRLDAGFQQRVPERHRISFRQHDLVAVLAGVTGTRHEQRHARRRLRMHGGETAELARRRLVVGGQQRDHLLAGGRALHRDHREVRSLLDAHVEGGGLLTDPRQILFAGGGVDHEAEEVFGLVVDDQVVDHPALRIQHAGVQRLARHLELVDRVGQQVAQEVAHARAVQVDHGHVADVEHAGVAAHQVVFVQLRAVMDGHVPAPEVHHLGAQGAVAGVEDGLLQAHGVGSRGKTPIIARREAGDHGAVQRDALRPPAPSGSCHPPRPPAPRYRPAGPGRRPPRRRRRS